MSAARERKEAAKRLAMALQVQHRKLLEAEGADAIQQAAIDLGLTFQQNIEAIVWFLKEYAGVDQMPLERRAAPKMSN